jgi:hypothetical protein
MSRAVGRVLGVAAIVALGLVLFLLARGWGTPPPLDISYDEIVRVQANVVPEGSAPPPFVRTPKHTWERPLSAVRADIPSPFPAPAGCQFWDIGTDGVQLSVWLTDGRQLDYSGCAFPGELEPLYNDAFTP